MRLHLSDSLLTKPSVETVTTVSNSHFHYVPIVTSKSFQKMFCGSIIEKYSLYIYVIIFLYFLKGEITGGSDGRKIIMPKTQSILGKGNETSYYLQSVVSVIVAMTINN